MQTCSKCNASSPDSAINCDNCHADLGKFSAHAVALKRMQDNPRVRSIRLSVADDACPYCYELLNTYPKDKVPHCSHEDGCCCFYEPVLEDTAMVGKVADEL
jgi:hypothetical protein